ncbi:MAG TPA: cobalamin-binding protein [Nitrospiria bacterium]|nr:cobalamin-binding protein [Nitrospiria bacterium]HUK56471.1 cobalamin-binding protein [Nitrospiria bacterium]
MRSKVVFAVLLFLFNVYSVFLAFSPIQAEPLVVTDDLGRSVRLVKSPDRIISLAPALTEILFSLGLKDRIVGVTDYCNYPPEALSKAKVGGLNANIERVLSLKPDLVVGVAGSYQQDNLTRFERFHIPYFVVDPSSLEKIFETILVLGRIADAQKTAEEKVRQLRERLNWIRNGVRAASSPRLLYVVDKEPLISIGKGSYLNDLIRDAGGINIAGGLKKAYPMLSMEYVIQQDPQVIILAMDADRRLSDQEKGYWSRWSSLSAVRDGKIYKVDRDLLNRPGPRIMDGLEELARLLHPTVDFESGR